MNKIILLFFMGIALSACNQKRTEETSRDIDTGNLIIARPDSSAILLDAHYFWVATVDNKSSNTLMKKLRPLSIDSLTAPVLIRQINDQNADIKLEFVKISNDTIFVKIRNSVVLTQQMGSSGADMYMTEVSYNLTELENINYVHFNFKEGDHASPGTYSRSDFVNVRFH